MNDLNEAHGGDLSDDFDPVSALAGPLMKTVLGEVAKKRQQHDGNLGYFRDFADGTAGRAISCPTISRDKENTREARRRLVEAGNKVTWRHLLESEFAEVLSEGDTERLRRQLIELAAHTVSWVEAIDRRKDERRIEKKMRPTFWARVKKWWRK